MQTQATSKVLKSNSIGEETIQSAGIYKSQTLNLNDNDMDKLDDNQESSMQNPNWFEVRSTTKAPDRRAYHSSFVYNDNLYILGGEDSHDGLRQSMHYINLNFIGSSPYKVGNQNIGPEWC